MTGAITLKSGLDFLAENFGSAYIETDPIALLHAYSDPRDLEVAGLAVSALSYGGTKQIRRSAKNMLARAGQSPAGYAERLDPLSASQTFHGFVHRWTRGEHMARLWHAMGSILREFGSIGTFVKSLDDPGEITIEGVLIRFSESVVRRMEENGNGMQPECFLSSLIPSPAAGSACKRLAMYFRWMVRGTDDIDLGLWQFISPSRLVIPLDRHIARMGRRLGMTRRQSDNWQTALEITAALRRLDPADPLRYDFALVRPGILGMCPPLGVNRCDGCPLVDFCIPGAG